MIFVFQLTSLACSAALIMHWTVGRAVAVSIKLACCWALEADWTAAAAAAAATETLPELGEGAGTDCGGCCFFFNASLKQSEHRPSVAGFP